MCAGMATKPGLVHQVTIRGAWGKYRLGCAGQRRIELKPGSELRAAEAAEI